MESIKYQTTHHKLKLFLIILAATLTLAPPTAYSRNVTHLLSIQNALKSASFQARLDPSVKLYFGDQKHPKITQSLGTFTSNQKTNAFNKTDTEACQWVLLTVLKSLQSRAIRLGGNAVVDIISFYKKNSFRSSSKYECHTGAIIAAVAMQGRVVRLAQ